LHFSSFFNGARSVLQTAGAIAGMLVASLCFEMS
jgi:hypothetical protein